MPTPFTIQPSLYDTTGSSLKSTTLLGAFAEGVILLLNGEKAFNRANKANPIQTPTIGNNFNTDSLAGTFSVPYLSDMDADGKIIEVARDYLQGIYTWVPGTGALASTINLPDAVLKMAQRLEYLNQLIIPNVVITSPNSVITINKDENADSYNIAIALPTNNGVNEVTGKIESEIVDYLTVLDSQLGF